MKSGERTNTSADRESRYAIEQETIEYLKNVEKILDANTFGDPEERETLINNTLNEIDGTEIRLMSHNVCSEILEKLLYHSSLSQVASFLGKIQGQYWHLSRKRFASHVVQTALRVFSKFVHQQQIELADGKDGSQNPIVTSILTFVAELEPHLSEAIRDTYASHVFRSLLILLSGKSSVAEQYTRSNSSKQFKLQNNLNQKQETDDFSVPEEFVECFHSILQTVIAIPGLVEFAYEPTASPTLQVLLLCCNAQEKEEFLTKVLGNRPESEMKTVLLRLSHDKIGSRFLQVVFQCVSQETLREYYESSFKDCFDKLLLSPSGIYVVKDLISCIKEKALLEEILEKLYANVDALKAKNNIVIVVKAAAKCSELHKCFKPMMKLIHSYFDLDKSPAEKDVQRLFQKPDLNVSLILQSIFSFSSKYSDVYSNAIARMSSEQLFSLATDCVFSHVLEAFFTSAASKDLKRTVSDTLNGSFYKMATDKCASHLLQTVWSQGSIDQKKAIAKELAAHRKFVEDSKHGFILMNEFKIEKYAYKPEEWEKELKSVDKKRKMLQEFLDI